MTTYDFLIAMRKKTGHHVEVTREMLRGMREVFEDLEVGEVYKIRGLGEFERVHMKSRLVNLAKGGLVAVPSYNKLVMRPSKIFRRSY